MNWSIILTIIGIIISIVIGIITFILTDRRSRRKKYQDAKALILQELSKSMGEGNIPNSMIVVACIKGVLREKDVLDLSVITIGEIYDDLLRKVTDDPFLDQQRRTELQQGVLDAMNEELQAKTEELDKATTDMKDIVVQRELRISEISSALPAAAASILAGLISAFVLTLTSFEKVTTLDTDFPDMFKILTTVVAALAIVLSVILLLRFRRKRKQGK